MSWSRLSRAQLRGAILAGLGPLLVSGVASAEVPAGGNVASPIRLASLAVAGKAIAPGDLLRTTRVFPNWNLNCEVLLSEGRHLCAAETRSVDAKGRQVFAWSIALGADGLPVMVFRTPGALDPGHGVRMTIGAFTANFVPREDECRSGECRIIAPFDQTLRTLVASQAKITFAFFLEGSTFRVDAPLAGLSEALDMARRDPVGLLATQRRTQDAVAKVRPISHGKERERTARVEPRRRGLTEDR